MVRNNTECVVKASAEEEEELLPWDVLLEAPIQIPLGKLLRLVLAFHQKLVAEGSSEQGLPVVGAVQLKAGPVPTVPLADTRVPIIVAHFKGLVIDHVLIDGGSGVNIATLQTCRTFGWLDWEPAPFLIRMADQRSVRPLGILKAVVIEVAGISFVVSFVVMNTEDHNEYGGPQC